jgi:predicted nucleotidyltransferase component of viral defense system
MFDYKNCDKSELEEAFVATAQKMNVSENIIEKDFWVCFILKVLFSLDGLKEHLTFKGGTSLSKIYRLIARFSEDIDISIERKFFGFDGEREPLNATSSKKSKKLIEELSAKCTNYVKDEFLKTLEKELVQYFETNTWSLEIDPDDKDQQTILFHYPSLFKSKSTYIKKNVKIEIGARSDHWPVSMKKVISYTEEMFPALTNENQILIRVLNMERTFWEKATILHKYAHFPTDKNVPLRQSRHYYDFYKLLHSDAKNLAISNLELLEKVVIHKELYFRSAWASYDTAKKGSLKLIPNAKILEAMETDYLAMQEMFFDEIPSWNTIVKSVSDFEKDFNSGLTEQKKK